jgi:hypothetical protein
MSQASGLATHLLHLTFLPIAASSVKSKSSTGPGLINCLHGQTVVAPNGFEPHPMVDVAFEK